MPVDRTRETYLGDGVYAVFKGWCIRLDLRAQDASRIALVPEVLQQLFNFAAASGFDVEAMAKDAAASVNGD